MNISGTQDIVLVIDGEHNETITLEKDAELTLTLVCIKDAQVQVEVELAEGASLNSHNLLLDRSVASITAKHQGSRTTSTISSKNIVKNEAKFTAKTIIEEQATNSKARQKIESVLLDPNARVTALPILDIRNNEVECGHGATVGTIDENVLFYLRSRGLSCKQAQEAIIDGHIRPFLAKLSTEEQKLVIV